MNEHGNKKKESVSYREADDYFDDEADADADADADDYCDNDVNDVNDVNGKIVEGKENRLSSLGSDDSLANVREFREEATYRDSSNLFILVYSFFAVFMTSGLLFGWPILRYQLRETFSNHQLDYIYTVGCVSAQASNFFFGLIRDRMGTRLTTCLILSCTIIACFSLALSNNNVHSFAASMFFFGCGTSLKLCLQPAADLFPAEYHGAIVSSTSGAFQLSGVIMSLFASYDRNQSSLLFGIYCIPLFGLVLIAVVILPEGNEFRKDYHILEETQTEKRSNDDESDGETDSVEIWIDVSDSDNKKNDDQEEVIIANKAKGIPTTLKDVLYSTDYILLVTWFSFQVIPSQYYFGTVAYQIENHFDEEGRYSRLFSFIFTLSAVTAPSIGIFADIFGIVSLHMYASIVPSISLFMLSSNSKFLKLFGMFVYSVGRIMIFNAFYIHIGKRYHFKYYGTLVGVGCLVSAISSLLQYPLMTRADSGQQVLVNFILGFAMILQGLPYCFWLRERIQFLSDIEMYANENTFNDC